LNLEPLVATGTAFSTTHIALTAALTGVLAIPLAYWLLRPRSWIDIVAIAVVTAASVFLWRKSAKMGQLNDDGLNPLSAND
jgi:membrane protein implicated in regulation of membrane protease activity